MLSEVYGVPSLKKVLGYLPFLLWRRCCGWCYLCLCCVSNIHGRHNLGYRIFIFQHVALIMGPERPVHFSLVGSTVYYHPSNIKIWSRCCRSVPFLFNDLPSLWERDFLFYFDGLDVFLPFPHWTVQVERTVIFLIFNTAYCSTFDTGKLSLTKHSVASIFVVFTQCSGLGM